MNRPTIRNRALAAVAALTLTAAIAAAPAAIGDEFVPKANGSGVDGYDLGFSFRALDPDHPSGEVGFETRSFGDQEGAVDCLDVRGRKVGISGELVDPTPSTGLDHFMLIANDRRMRHGEIRDRFTSWLSTGEFDCATDAYDDDYTDALKRIRSGNIHIVPWPSLPKSAPARDAKTPTSGDALTVNAAD